MNKNNYLYQVKFNNYKEILYNTVKLYPNTIAFTLKENIKDTTYRKLTFTDFLNEVNNLGSSFYNSNFKDKRIAIIGKNCYEWAITYITNLVGNIISIPLDPGLMEGELETSLIRSKADVIIFDLEHKDLIKKIKENNSTNLTDFICMKECEEFKSIKTLILEGKQLRNNGYKEYENSTIDDNDMKVLIFTSGTTSQSKIVMLSEKNIAENIYSLQLVQLPVQTDTNYAFLPFHHALGSTSFLMMLASGANNCFPDGLRYIAQNLKEYQVSVFIAVPEVFELMYSKILKEIEKSGKTKKFNKGIKLSKFLLKFHIDIRRKLFKEILNNLGGKLRYIINGAAPISPETYLGFHNLGININQGYGLTETSPVLAIETEKSFKVGSVGKAIPNVKIKINNPDSNGIGEIIAQGPNIFLGYYENEEETKKVLHDGWFYTGDLGYIDNENFLFITGRQKNMIVLKNGKKVFPEEFEMIIDKIPEVSESMVFGLPKDDDVLISVKIKYNKNYISKTYNTISDEELYNIIWNKIKDFNKTLPTYKYIKNLILTEDDFIKTSTGKIKRNEEMKKINMCK